MMLFSTTKIKIKCLVIIVEFTRTDACSTDGYAIFLGLRIIYDEMCSYNCYELML